MSEYSTFGHAIDQVQDDLLDASVINRGRWQGIDTAGKPDLETHELTNVQLSVPVGRGCSLTKGGFGSAIDGDEILDALAREIKPNLPWADDHFEERVSRVPSNPGEEYKNWPWWHGQEDATKVQSEKYESEQGKNFQFTHTYQERFWPRLAGPLDRIPGQEIHGIRYAYGDLDDVVSLLVREPYTRQATFPIFFPEDTGAVHGGRIPCTLHYHFLMMADGSLDLYYPIRSCDYVRHFRDDLYMACRLLLWVIGECKDREIPMVEGEQGAMPVWLNAKPGFLHFTAYSLHVHRGDLHRV